MAYTLCFDSVVGRVFYRPEWSCERGLTLITENGNRLIIQVLFSLQKRN